MTDQPVQDLADSLTIAQLTKAYKSLDAKIDALKEIHKSEMKPLDDALEQITGALTIKLDKENMKSAPNEFGTPYFTHGTSFKVEDRGAWFRWAVAHEAWDCFTPAVSKDGIMALDELPAGIKATPYRKLCVRKPS